MAGFDYAGAVSLLKEAKTVALCGHRNPDGDCLGSVLALAQALQSLGIEAAPLLATREKPQLYDFLPGFEQLTPAADYSGEPDVFVMLDVPEDARMDDAAAVRARSRATVKIDHHAGPADIADYSYIDTDAAAAGVLVWELLPQLGAERTAGIARCCYAALLTDTGSFRFQNADQRAFEAAAQMVAAGAEPSLVATMVYQRKSLAALQLESRVAQRARFACGGRMVISWMDEADLAELGATKDDCEELTDVVRQIAGPEVSVILRGQGDHIRGSIRSKTTHDVQAIAKKMNGGGHKAASGFTLYGDIQEAIDTVIGHVAASFEGGAEEAVAR